MLWEGDQLSWGLKNQLLYSQMTKVPQVHRCPHLGEPSTPHVVRGMACALGGKANKIQTSPEYMTMLMLYGNSVASTTRKHGGKVISRRSHMNRGVVRHGVS